MKKIIYILAMIIGTTVHAQQKTIVIAMEDGWAPYAMLDSRGESVGIGTELIREIFLATGWKIEMAPYPFFMAEVQCIRGKVDVYANTLMSEALVPKLHFPTTPLFINYDVIWGNSQRNDVVFKNLENLRGKKVGVVRGYPYSDDFMAATFFEKVEYDSTDENIEALIANKVDAIIEDRAVMKYTLKKMKKQAAIKELGAQHENPVFIGITKAADANKKGKDFHERIKLDYEKGLEIIKKNGKYDAIFKKYE